MLQGQESYAVLWLLLHMPSLLALAYLKGGLMPNQDNTLQNFSKSGALCKYLCMSRTQFNKLLKAGQFPAPYRMGGVNVWAKADVIAWLESTRQTKAPNDTQGGV